MYVQIEKPKENKRRAVANSVAQRKGFVEQNFGFVDNRPEAISQRKLKALSDINHLTKQLSGIQRKANNDYQAHKSAQLQANIHKQGTDKHVASAHRVIQTLVNPQGDFTGRAADPWLPLTEGKQRVNRLSNQNFQQNLMRHHIISLFRLRNFYNDVKACSNKSNKTKMKNKLSFITEMAQAGTFNYMDIDNDFRQRAANTMRPYLNTFRINLKGGVNNTWPNNVTRDNFNGITTFIPNNCAENHKPNDAAFAAFDTFMVNQGGLANERTMFKWLRYKHKGAFGALANQVVFKNDIQDQTTSMMEGNQGQIVANPTIQNLIESAYEWIPGNLFEGPRNRVDDPGNDIDTVAKAVIGQETFNSIHVPTDNAMIAFHNDNSSKTNFNTAIKGLEKIRKLRTSPWPFNDNNWEKDTTTGDPKVKR